MDLQEKYAEQLNAIDARHDELVTRLIGWSNINSGSYHLEGVSAYREVLQKAFSGLFDADDRLEVVKLPSFEVLDEMGEIASQDVSEGLIMSKRPHCEKRILLCGHMDTVFPEDHPFQRCEYIDKNTLNGPGVADMKGGILVMLTALETLESHPAAKNIGWDVYLSSDEEIGSFSSASVFPKFANNAFGMIYEPSLPAGEFVGERKGSGNFSVVVKGRASHAGRAFYDGRNAIVKLSRIIADMHDLNDPKESTTLNIGTVSGGQALNVVPDLAIAKFNIRIAKNEDADKILAKVDAILEKHAQEDYEIFRHGRLSRPMKPMDRAQDELFEMLKKVSDALGLPTKVVATGGCCDGNNLKALGLPNIDTLGVRGGLIHSDEEFVLLDSLCERAKLSALILLAFADGEILQS